MTGRPLEVFVAPRGNAFMRDIAAWIVEAGAETGRPARLRDDGGHPTDPAAINLVVAPHEFFLLGDLDDATIHRSAAISVPVCTEQPGTRWFDIGAIATQASSVTLDINRHGVAAFRELGREARHLQLGGVPSMRAAEIRRDLDVVFLGGDTERRRRELGRLAPLLWDREVDIRVFSFHAPVRDGSPGLVFGHAKYELMARARILLNLHRDDTRPGYFEWARMVEAMANGCCVVTEPVSDHAPFEAGVHFVETDDVPSTLATLLDDRARCEEIGANARRAVLDQHPLADRLGELLPELESTPAREPGRVRRYRSRMVRAEGPPLLPAFRSQLPFRRRVLDAMIAETEHGRRIERALARVRHRSPAHVTIERSASYDAAEPSVSVVVTLYDYADLVAETLDSVAASEGIDLEILVVDDHSRDEGRDVVVDYLRRHAHVPMALVGHAANQGLAAARNTGFAHARADLVMVMDADNLVYPNALRRLTDALDRDPGAAFAYSTLAEFGAETGLRSAMAWNVERLCHSNYIDAQAMIRRDAWQRAGGYRGDGELMFGWEDWELWLRLAAAGERGVHVPQMSGRYRVRAGSMVSTTNLVGDFIHERLRELHPDLPWPAP